MGSKTQRTVPYKDADEAFEAWWDSLPDAQRKYWRHCAAAV